ncbi:MULTISPECIES: hypothetical protein [unclassified Bacteroides]|uniref:hypothetical protein n=1 Tax=unclassified Bacteroides TaxID=2646097 RepID=UPI004062AF93
MNYGLIYTIPFATLDNSDCIVEIEKKGYTGVSTELTGGASPFVVDIADDEFAYTPLRFSTATINVVGGDYLQELFSTAYQQYRVTLKKNGNITWCGFVKPELYTQDYSSEIFTLELECISAMSTLEFIDYTQSEESGRKFVSLWDLIKKCIDSSSSQYNAVYFPQVYGKDASDVVGGNILKEMTVSEQNFFDEDNKPMKLKEVLEEICKFLHWTCADWCGSLYFVDIDHKGNYSRYPSDLSQKSGEESISVKSVQDIGFAGSEHSLDVLPGYNKVTVKCSNYPVGELLPEEEYDKLKYISHEDKGIKISGLFKKYRLIKLDAQIYKVNKIVSGDNLPNGESADLVAGLGAYLGKLCVYGYENGKAEISNYNYDNVLCIDVLKRQGWADSSGYAVTTPLPQGVEVFSFKRKNPELLFADGAFCISGQVMQLSNGGHAWLKDHKKWGITLVCELKIGDYYYNGENFVTQKSVFQIKVNDSNKMLQYFSTENTKDLRMPYNGAEGYIIQIPDTRLRGILSFKMYTPILEAVDYTDTVFIKNFKIKYYPKDNSILSKSNNNSDRIYENVINGSYINELDEIEAKISSYNDDGACYSKVILNDGYLTDNLYSSIELDTIRPEELLIRRIVHRYSAPQIKLTQVIKATSDLTPISVLSDRFMTNKKFINVGGTIDFKMNRFNCIMIEK